MKKGQAALEFLTTYGWAFLVILVMIGALAYFGVLNPKSLLPGRCQFGPEVDCVEYYIDSSPAANDILRFRFRNNIGSTANFSFSSTYLGGSNSVGTCAISGASTVRLQPGRISEVICTFASTSFPQGDKVKFEVVGNYTKTDGQYSIPVKGDVYGEVQ